MNFWPQCPVPAYLTKIYLKQKALNRVAIKITSKKVHLDKIFRWQELRERVRNFTQKEKSKAYSRKQIEVELVAPQYLWFGIWEKGYVTLRIEIFGLSKLLQITQAIISQLETHWLEICISHLFLSMMKVNEIFFEIKRERPVASKSACSKYIFCIKLTI